MRLEADVAARLLHAGDVTIPCAIGRGGGIAADAKREGDGATPLGAWPIRGVMLRPDRGMRPLRNVPWRWLRPEDGWSDDPLDPGYNRAVRHPHAWSAERLWRDDGLYDAIVVLGHNDDPPRPGAGSAIFLHCWRDGAPTEGCVALEGDRLQALLPHLTSGDTLLIR